MKYTFGTKINGTKESGIIDMDTLKVICLCPESNSELLLQALNMPVVSGSLLTDEQSYQIAQKFYDYCLLDQNDKPFIGAKAIPLIFDECLKALASNDR